MNDTLRSYCPRFWSVFTKPRRTLPAGTARDPRMSGGGSLEITGLSAVLAGTRATGVPSGSVTDWMGRTSLPEVASAEAITPPTKMNTAMPRTIMAGPRRDRRW